MASAPTAARGRESPSPLVVLWRFGRPHTVIGTTLSVVGLWLIVLAHAPGVSAGLALRDLVLTLVAAYCVNVFIVGVNQLEDVEIDRVNKPFLPIAAGHLSPHRAKAVVATAGVVPLALALTQGWVETVAVAVALAVGVAYSSPPLRIKRYPALAALSISGVRSLVVNLGVTAHFAAAFAAEPAIPDSVIALTLFTIPFAVAIALLKDVPDSEGDRRFRIATYTVRLGGRRVLAIGLGALGLAYGGMALLGPWLVSDAQPLVLAGTHLAALALLLRWARAADPEDPVAFTSFYMQVWKLFFAEYLLVAAAVLLG